MNSTIDFLKNTTCGTTQAAKMLQVSVGTIHHMIERGELEAWFTTGGHRRISLDAIKNCQMRRRMKISFSSMDLETFQIVVVASDPEIFAELIMILGPLNNDQRKSVNFYSKPTKMLLDSNALNVHMLVLDVASLFLLGGFSWLSEFRELNKYKQTQILLIGETSTPEEAAASLIYKADITQTPIDISWLKGYVCAAETSWKLTCQF